jgi:hypothetical protein
MLPTSLLPSLFAVAQADKIIGLQDGSFRIGHQLELLRYVIGKNALLRQIKVIV